MLINIRVSELISDTNNNIPLAILVIIAFFIPINNLLPDSKTDLSETGLINNIINREQVSYVTSNN